MAGEEPACASGSADGKVDLEALISAFLADEDSASLELPAGLSPEQRKAARRLTDQHPELKCESYGFGEERRLHLFKRGQDRMLAQSAAYHVKNTFIDDWKESKGEEPAFRSMPPSMMPPSVPIDLLERTLQRCLDTKQELREGSSGTASPRSTTTAGGHDLARALDASPSSNADLPAMPEGMPEGFKVRNTFIHIESVPVVERIVQSMPHGMFRQCLEAELQAQQPGEATPEELTSPSSAALAPGCVHVAATASAYTAAAAPCLAPPPAPLAPPAPLRATPAAGMLATSPPGAPPAAPPPAPPSRPPALPAAASSSGSVPGPPCGEEGILAPGVEVVIQGLVKLPDFNGLTGLVQALDPETGRYDVLLDGPAGQCGWKWVKVKGENCRLKMPPPPQNAPTLAMDCLHDDGGPAEDESVADIGSGAVPKTPAWDEDFSCQVKGAA